MKVDEGCAQLPLGGKKIKAVAKISQISFEGALWYSEKKQVVFFLWEFFSNGGETAYFGGKFSLLRKMFLRQVNSSHFFFQSAIPEAWGPP